MVRPTRHDYISPEARRTLKREFVDYLFTQAARPYAEMVSLQGVALSAVLKQLEAEVYRRKERIIEVLERLID